MIGLLRTRRRRLDALGKKTSFMGCCAWLRRSGTGVSNRHQKLRINRWGPQSALRLEKRIHCALYLLALLQISPMTLNSVLNPLYMLLLLQYTLTSQSSYSTGNRRDSKSKHESKLFHYTSPASVGSVHPSSSKTNPRRISLELKDALARLLNLKLRVRKWQ